MRDEGHEIANHSRSHIHLGNASPERCETEIQQCSDAIYNATSADGKPVIPAFFRPPYLSKGGNLLAICARKGLPLIEGISSKDYQSGENSGSAQAQAAAIINSARNWLIALNHDPCSGNPACILEALSLMADGLRALGYYPVTVSELLALREGTLMPGKVYTDFEDVP
jgi:peptidoglycan/xylan/chitin deacetylase (PgdA/CDA1 family)